jgi:CTP synthase (UTP-ammonia lyase)
MPDAIRIALVGDFRAEVVAHVCIPRALALAATALDAHVSTEWIGSDAVSDPSVTLASCDGIWLVPASPYRDMDGALAAVRFAREQKRPFLGTCGGFQHALIEIARHVLGAETADHAETNPAARELVVAPLSCSLVGQTGTISFTPASRLHALFEHGATQEAYHCNYGPSPAWRTRLETAGLRFTGFDDNGEIRAAELPAHPFFVGTLFQPERSALTNRPHPLITAFVHAAAHVRGSR